MKRITDEQKMTIQFWAGLVIVAIGLVLLFLGFWAVPIGEIAPTVLTAFGEIATFAGALIGVDYRYRYKMFEKKEDYRHRRYGEAGDIEPGTWEEYSGEEEP